MAVRIEVEPDGLTRTADRALSDTELLGHALRLLGEVDPTRVGPLEPRVATPATVWVRHEVTRLERTADGAAARAHHLREVARTYADVDAGVVPR